MADASSTLRDQTYVSPKSMLTVSSRSHHRSLATDTALVHQSHHHARNHDFLLNTTAPSISQVDTVLVQDLGLESEIVGYSYENRPLKVYHWPKQKRQTFHKKKKKKTTVSFLLLSMVHGNEPMGLLTLLETVRRITSNNSSLTRNNIELIVFPLVNVDAYQLNLDYHDTNNVETPSQNQYGCRRTNLNDSRYGWWATLAWLGLSTVPSRSPVQVKPCPSITHRGVDLNRNHPRDFDWIQAGGGGGGAWFPWSEPESRAIRHVVLKHGPPTAALSFHSRRQRQVPPLLIHPYASTRRLERMHPHNQQLYQSLGRALNRDHFYIVGTAQQAIRYTAGGSTIDWMHSIGTLSLVMEVTPPCSNRWCENATEVWQTLERYSATGPAMAEWLIAQQQQQRNGHLLISEGFAVWPYILFILSLLFMMLYCLSRCCRRICGCPPGVISGSGVGTWRTLIAPVLWMGPKKTKVDVGDSETSRATTAKTQAAASSSSTQHMYMRRLVRTNAEKEDETNTSHKDTSALVSFV